MDDAKFEHMLKLSTVFISVMQARSLFEEEENWSDSDRHGYLNCLEIVADTFVEMQSRLGVKPKFRLPARSAT